MDSRKVFDEQYEDCMSKIKNVDFSKKADILGARIVNQGLVLDFFNRRIALSNGRFTDLSGDTVTVAIGLVLCKYLCLCPDQPVESPNRLITFREFSDSGPLFSSFTANTNKIIESAFTGKLERLKSRCITLGGTITKMGGYDLTMRFMALPRIPIVFNFNDADDLMPATAGFLYHDNANRYLDLECLPITCTYLTGQLIKS